MAIQKQTRKQNKSSKLHSLMSTQYGLHHWHTSMFEKLGWMVLAKAKGLDYKVDTYKKSIDRLIASIKHLSSEYESRNRKHDLNVLLIHTECLKDFVDKHL